MPEALSSSGPENHRLSSQDWFNSLLVLISMRKLGNIDLSPSSRGCNQHLGSSLQATTVVEAAARVGVVVPATLPRLQGGKWNNYGASRKSWILVLQAHGPKSLQPDTFQHRTTPHHLNKSYNDIKPRLQCNCQFSSHLVLRYCAPRPYMICAIYLPP